MNDAPHALAAGFLIGFFVGCFMVLFTYNTAIKEYQFKQYKQTHTNNITFQEWEELQQ